DHGQTGLSTAFDVPSLMGHDSDHPKSLGEVGREGVAVDTLDDMATLFEGIDLADISVSMTINAPAVVMLAFYVAAAEQRGIPAERLRGTIQADILKEYIAQKEWCFPIDPAMRLLGDMVEWCSLQMPRWHPVSISGYHIREAGSTAAQELAFTLKDGFTYVEWALERGLEVDAFAPRLSFFFNAHLDFFEEIAKYRAARRIWAREMRDRYGARDERSLLMRFHTQTAGVSLTWQQPLVNVARTAVEALAAVLGGTQSLHTNSYDEALALPTEQAVRVALRTQQIIAYESGVVNTIDPLAGSYFIESLTNQVEEGAQAYLKKIDSLGGTLKDGFTYVEWALERGLEVDAFAPRLSFFFNTHLDFFEEIAKYRAARRIWARELRDTYGARDERSLLMRFHTQTAGVSLTAQQPMVNIARTAIEALAGVLGGTQSLHTNSYDEALALPTEGAARLALRTQQVIAHETGVVNTIDPLGGSYHVEALTNRLEAEAYELFRRIDELGG
ncbi:MAG TPA: methylmalonyl-CoA mutase family protein, partial [Casimicrobiaceae bacterium]|nr:methylmalonyl-CoA mutase family protein [Casimicrobiaceae bacterium]